MEPEMRILLWPLMRMAFLSYVTVLHWISSVPSNNAIQSHVSSLETELVSIFPLGGWQLIWGEKFKQGAEMWIVGYWICNSAATTSIVLDCVHCHSSVQLLATHHLYRAHVCVQLLKWSKRGWKLIEFGFILRL